MLLTDFSFLFLYKFIADDIIILISEFKALRIQLDIRKFGLYADEDDRTYSDGMEPL